MISYEYTKVNRLENPHKYMYTPYLSSDFVNAYFCDRLKNVRRFQLKGKKSYNNIDLYLYAAVKNKFDSLLNQESFELIDDLWQHFTNGDHFTILETKQFFLLNNEIENLSYFDTKNNVDTEALLSSLVYSQLSYDDNNELIQQWLDRLVQRFEVTKKLYVNYPVNSRKGRGEMGRVRLYWLFLLSLTLNYVSTNNIKYLSTLLKVSDILCSLDDDILVGELPFQGLLLVLLVELLSIKVLLGNIEEVDFVFE
jgi:hypothetical protein